MTLLNLFKSKAQLKSGNIGIGLAESEEQNFKILQATVKFIKTFNSTVYLFGNEKAIDSIKNSHDYKDNSKRIELVKSKTPEKEICNFLNNNIIHAIVRGNFSSSKFLKNIKELFQISLINRLALLETYNGFQFFYGPVGIDECKDIESKIDFVNKAINQFELLKIEPRISILSGGRLGDIGRDAIVDKTINIAEEVVAYLQKEYPTLRITHNEILIENAINNKSNLIIAPDGISGNLIYRTLVHLGGGKAYGAIYMDLPKVIIDTSRVGNLSEIYGALILALALTPA